MPRSGVLIIDNGTVDLEGAAALIRGEPDLEVCAKMTTPAEAVTSETRPTVVMLGLVSGGPSDLESIETLKARFPDAKILVLAHTIELTAVRDAIASGVDGYVSKTAPSSVLLRAVRTVAVGKPFLDPTIGIDFATEHDRNHPRPAVDNLTRVETEVLRQIALGHTNPEIAEILARSLRTIETHRAHIQRKLNVRTRADLVRIALAAGLIRLSDSTDTRRETSEGA